MNTLLSKKHAELVNAFLLYKYRHSSQERKDRYERETRAERIARTMRLEGEPVSAEDVRRWLRPKT